MSGIRQTVREGAGQDEGGFMLSRLPQDLTGKRVLDAGCGTGAMTEELARRGAEVVAIDISPSLVDIAAKAPAGGACRAGYLYIGRHAVVGAGPASTTSWQWTSMIYYEAPDLGRALAHLCPRVREKHRLHRRAAHRVPHGLLDHGQAVSRGPTARRR